MFDYQGNLTKISRSCNLIKDINCKLWQIQPHPGGVRSHQGAGEDLWRGCRACQVWGQLCFKHSTICDGEVLYHKLNSQYSNEFLRHCRMCVRSFHHNNRNLHDCQVWVSKRLQMLPWKRLQREDVDAAQVIASSIMTFIFLVEIIINNPQLLQWRWPQARRRTGHHASHHQGQNILERAKKYVYFFLYFLIWSTLLTGAWRLSMLRMRLCLAKIKSQSLPLWSLSPKYWWSEPWLVFIMVLDLPIFWSPSWPNDLTKSLITHWKLSTRFQPWWTSDRQWPGLQILEASLVCKDPQSETEC